MHSECLRTEKLLAWYIMRSILTAYGHTITLLSALHIFSNLTSLHVGRVHALFCMMSSTLMLRRTVEFTSWCSSFESQLHHICLAGGASNRSRGSWNDLEDADCAER
jgi:hypothetical protein